MSEKIKMHENENLFRRIQLYYTDLFEGQKRRNILTKTVATIVFVLFTAGGLKIYNVYQVGNNIQQYKLTEEARMDVINHYFKYQHSVTEGLGGKELDDFYKTLINFNNISKMSLKSLMAIGRLHSLTSLLEKKVTKVVDDKIKDYEIICNKRAVDKIIIKEADCIEFKVLKDGEELQYDYRDYKSIDINKSFAFITTDDLGIAKVIDNKIIAVSKGETFLNIINGLFWIRIKIFVE